MSVQALQLPDFSAREAEARRRLGRGLRLPFAVGDEQGELVLEPGCTPSAGALLQFECAHGVLALSEPSALLSLFGDCPVPLPSAAADDWFWALFDATLSPALRELFGHLKPSSETVAQPLSCRLNVTLGAARALSRLCLSAESLLALCAHASWQRLALALPQTWPLQLPLKLGRLQLRVGQLRRLRHGDVVLPETPLFDASGHGELRLGRHVLAVRVDAYATPPNLTVEALEERLMEEDFTASNTWDNSHDDEPAPYQQAQGAAEGNDQSGSERFDDLLLALTLRCGELRLSLGELRDLAPGALLEIIGSTPGMACLYYGEQPVAHGELVEVDGRLGLQVTRVDFGG